MDLKEPRKLNVLLLYIIIIIIMDNVLGTPNGNTSATYGYASF
jgi:hypothetical protein